VDREKRQGSLINLKGHLNGSQADPKGLKHPIRGQDKLVDNHIVEANSGLTHALPNVMFQLWQQGRCP
jgi:hypothetical protein